MVISNRLVINDFARPRTNTHFSGKVTMTIGIAATATKGHYLKFDLFDLDITLIADQEKVRIDQFGVLRKRLAHVPDRALVAVGVIAITDRIFNLFQLRK